MQGRVTGTASRGMAKGIGKSATKGSRSCGESEIKHPEAWKKGGQGEEMVKTARERKGKRVRLQRKRSGNGGGSPN